jgi:hypothetical protein
MVRTKAGSCPMAMTRNWPATAGSGGDIEVEPAAPPRGPGPRTRDAGAPAAGVGCGRVGRGHRGAEADDRRAPASVLGEDSVVDQPVHGSVGDGTRVVAEARWVVRAGGRLILVQPNFPLNPGGYFDDFRDVSILTDCRSPITSHRKAGPSKGRPRASAADDEIACVRAVDHGSLASQVTHQAPRPSDGCHRDSQSVYA